MMEDTVVDVVWPDLNRGMFMGILISETTREERERIVAESIGNINGACDGCMAGLSEMYQDYIDGKKKIRQINMEFRATYESGAEGPVKEQCGFAAMNY